MSKIVMKEEDEFLVNTKSIISSFDRKILTRLYQPLVGSSAFSLYLTLLSELEFDKTITSLKQPLSSLTKLMSISFDELILAKNKLEGVGLIKTYKSKSENYFVFSLFAPLTPFDYFDNPLLDNLLKKQLGQIEYDRNKQYFTFANIDNNDLIDVSSDFEDAYTKINDVNKKNNSRSANKNVSTIKLSFDYDVFYEKLASFQVSKKAISKEVLEKLPYLSYVYNINPVDMADIITRAQIKTGVAEIKLVKELCLKYASNNTIEVVKSNVDTGDTYLNQLITLYDSNTPIEFISIKFDHLAVPENQELFIYSMINTYHLSNSVMNAILDYMFEKTNNSFVNKFLEILCADIARKQISTSYDAYVALRSSPNKQNVDNKEVNEDENEEDYQSIIERNLKILNSKK